VTAGSVRARTIVAVLALAAGLTGARVTDATAGPAIAAVIAPDGQADVRTSIVVGPSGQVYAGDGTGRWVRTVAGGVAADVSGATRLGRDLLVTGISTPMYRFDGAGWVAVRVGQNGKTILGRGPTPAVAIGRQVFLERQDKWVRVGEAPGTVTAVWASGKRVFAVTAAGVHTLRGRNFVMTGAVADPIAGPSAWAVASDGVVELASGRKVLAATGIVAATGSGGTPWLLTAADASPLRLVGRVDGKPVTGDTPIAAGTAIAGMTADRAGNLVIVSTTGEIHVRVGDAWSTGSLVDELPAAKPGPGPASTR